MPLYGVYQSGYNTGFNAGLNLTSVMPGDSFTLFSGTETPAAGVKSVAFSRAPSIGGSDNGISFYIQFPSAATATVQVQVAFADVDADYQTVFTSTFAGATTQDSYTDVGRAPFYRVVLSAYTSGGMPIVTANR